MNLEDLKQALSSDATEKAKRLEQETSRLRSEIKKKDKIIADRNDVLRAMFNRCYVQQVSMGATMCIFCAHESLCYHLRNVGKKEEST